jgi:hypothetical protein
MRIKGIRPGATASVFVLVLFVIVLAMWLAGWPLPT